MDFYRRADVMASTMVNRTCLVFGLVLCFSACIALQIAGYESTNGDDENDSFIRHRREIEDLSEEFVPPVESQDEPGFWQKVVNVAIRIFNGIMAWLNSS